MVANQQKQAAGAMRARRTTLTALRYGWPIIALLGILWFPFDWLAVVWPTFGVPFRRVFHNAHDHFIGHSTFFFIVGALLLAYIPAARRRPHWYAIGVAGAALAQETVQAVFRHEIPTFTDYNAFRGDALGGALAFALWAIVGWSTRFARRRRQTAPV